MWFKEKASNWNVLLIIEMIRAMDAGNWNGLFFLMQIIRVLQPEHTFQ
jgi:hypothetical protein